LVTKRFERIANTTIKAHKASLPNFNAPNTQAIITKICIIKIISFMVVLIKPHFYYT
jgi:hypothetical protein